MISGNDLNLAEAIRAGARHSLSVVLLNPHSPLGAGAPLPITKWEETSEPGGDLRKYTFGVPLMVDGVSMWPGDNPAHPLYPAGQQASISWVVQAGLAVWSLPMGTYDLIEVSRDSSTVAVEASSPTHALALVEQTSPYVTRQGEGSLALARRIARTGVVLKGISDTTPAKGLVLDVNARKSLDAVVDAWPARQRFSANGIELVPPADPAATPVAELPASSGLIFGGDSISRDDIVTRVIASGSGASSAGVGVAEENAGPLSSQFVGYQTATWSSPLLSTNASARAAAATRLTSLRNKSRTQDIVVTLDPRLEMFDVIKVTQSAAVGRPGGWMVGQIVKMTRGFPAATMTVTLEVFDSEEE